MLAGFAKCNKLLRDSASRQHSNYVPAILRRFVLITEPFSRENGLLGWNGKPLRDAVIQR